MNSRRQSSLSMKKLRKRRLSNEKHSFWWEPVAWEGDRCGTSLSTNIPVYLEYLCHVSSENVEVDASFGSHNEVSLTEVRRILAMEPRRLLSLCLTSTGCPMCSLSVEHSESESIELYTGRVNNRESENYRYVPTDQRRRNRWQSVLVRQSRADGGRYR